MIGSDDPIAYIERIREYYLGLGYETPYRWARNADVPFAPLAKLLCDCNVAVVTTAAPYNPAAGAQGAGAAYNGAAKFFSVYDMGTVPSPDVRISHIAYDRQHTSATDINTWLPLQSLFKLAEEGVVGRVCDRFFGLPTNRSHVTTTTIDCPELVRRVLASGADACVLVPNCPVCHQSVSLAAAHLESAGISTVVMGCAKDIVEWVGVPRFVFSDFPLGNSAGKPHDANSQRETLLLALQLLAEATGTGTTVVSPQRWNAHTDWKEDYCNINRLSEEERLARRAEFDREKQKAKAVRS